MEHCSYLMCTTPWGERCAQIGDDNFRSNTKLEATAYTAQLIRTFGDPPKGTFFKWVWCKHEFGNYLDIQFHYDDEDQQHVIYADNLERGIENWDDQALEALRKSGYVLPSENVIPIRQVDQCLRKRQKGA